MKEEFYMNTKLDIPYIPDDLAPEITWSTLFFQKLQTRLKNGFKSSNPDEFEKHFSNSTNIEFTKYLIKKILPSTYRTMPDGSDITDVKKGTFSKYWTYSPATTSTSRYRTTIDRIIRKARTGNYLFETFEFNKSLYENIETILSWLSDEDLIIYESYINKLINNLDKITSFKKRNLKKLFEKSNMTSFSMRFSCLVAIAATWPVWSLNDPICEDLSFLILPSVHQKGETSQNDTDWLQTHIKRKKEASAKKFAEALILYDQKNYQGCCDLCKEIIGLVYVDDIVRGEAYYRLAICCAKHKYEYKGIFDPSTFLQKASDYGCTEASILLEQYAKLTQKDNDCSSKHLLFNPIPSTSGSAYIVTNTNPENICMRTFLKTVPDSMISENTEDDHIIYATSTCSLLKVLTPEKDLRYLLIDDSQEKNFKDFISILDNIKFWKAAIMSDDIDWSKITFYLRVSEERYSALIDTALKRINGLCVRIHIIDDNKWPVQHLLSRHPLFNSLQSFNNYTLHEMSRKKITINYIVISAQNDDLTNWLIREAFWLGCFYYANVTVSITVLSPKADLIDLRLRYDCPGIFDPKFPDDDNTSKIQMNNPELVDSLTSPALFDKIEMLNESNNSFNYYVINAGDDISNMNLAVKIREWTIRKQIEKGNNPDRMSLPFISFYCKDPDIGHLSKQLIVQTIEHGNNWYNNYNLVPFGMLSDRYTWDAIDGGYYERLAQCTHLQYSGVYTSADKETIEKKLVDYFNRCYNRDSSMAVALSIPYRLFQTTVDSKTHHIIPACGWNNMDTNVYNDLMKSSKILSEMASLFKKAISDNIDNKKHLLFYEHSRWLRYAISRGWISADPEQVVNYMKAGNPKQQLYIARMHGCICSIEGLNLLAEQMSRNANKKNWKRFAAAKEPIIVKLTGSKERAYASNYTYTPKDFVATDKSNIEATADILQTKWFESSLETTLTEQEK